jgi:hypothetical protein
VWQRGCVRGLLRSKEQSDGDGSGT